jgi:hypothetical protein
MRCGTAIQDRAVPDLTNDSVAEYASFLEAYASDKPNKLSLRIDEHIVRFETGSKVYGGTFTGLLMHAFSHAGVLGQHQLDQWGISWFPTYNDLLAMCRQFLAANTTMRAQAA